MELSVRNVLASLPQNAVVFGSTDEFDVGTRYLQLAVGLRPDVVFLRTPEMLRAWYRARYFFHGLTYDPRVDTNVTLARKVLDQGRPLFVTLWDKPVITAFPSYRFGVFVRVLPPGSQVPSLDEVVAINRGLFENYDLDYPPPGPDDEIATIVHVRYAGVWKRIGDALAASGRPQDAAWAYDISTQLAPK